MMRPKVSVIVPVYNTAALLPRCIDSLLNQTLKEIQIILVDDASTDGSLNVLQSYKANHPTLISLIASPVNQRQGGARNLGLDIASGEYIGFVDSDDWAEPTMFEALYTRAVLQDSDLCYCYRNQEVENGNVQEDDASYYLPEGEVGDNKRRKMLVNHVTFVQRYLYHRDFFDKHQVRFPAHLRYEDLFIDPLILLYARKIAAVQSPLYNYFIRSGSTTTMLNEEKYRDKLQVCKLIIEAYKARGEYAAYRQEINSLFFRKGYIHTSINYLLNAKEPSPEIIREIRLALLDVDSSYRRNQYYKSRISFQVIDRLLSSNSSIALKLLKFLLKTARYNV